MPTSNSQRLADEPFLRWLLPRSAALFVALCCFKAALLFSVRSDLIETHWRTQLHPPMLFDWVNFAVFAGLVFAGFVLLGRRSASAPKRTIRLANFALVLTGCGFVFFTFHRIELAYLYAVMWSLLSFRGMGSYLIMDCFFAPPFLAAYFFSYALAYWILVRTKREHWSFCLLGTAAVAYLFLNLKQLAAFRETFLIINCLGVASLATALFSRQPIRARVLLSPLLLLVPGFWMFSAKVVVHGQSPYSVLLLSVTLVLFAGIWIATRHSQLESIIRNFLLFWFAAFLLLANRYYPFANNFDYLFAYAMALPHYAMGELLCVTTATVLFLLLAFWSTRLARFVFYTSGALLIVAAFVDFETTQALGTRLDWSVLTMSDNLVLAWKTIRPYFTSVAWIGGLGLIAFCVLSSRAASDRMRELGQRLHKGSLAYVVIALALFCFVGRLAMPRDKAEGFAFGRVVTTSPLAKIFDSKRVDRDQFFKIGESLALLPAMAPASTASIPTNRFNVVLVVMESSYNKYLSLFGAADETQPLLKKYRDRMELFPNFYSVFPNSFHARFAVLSGLYPIKEYVSSVNPRIEAPSLLDLLHAAGYVTDVFQSDPREYVGFADYIRHRHVDHWFDCSNMPGSQKSAKLSWGVEEKVTLEAMRQQIAAHRRKNERFFLSYFPVAPHMPFDTPSKEFDKFPSGDESVTHDYSGRYKNQLLYMDWILTTLIDTVAEEGLLENTIVIITNDHGEMLGDQDERHRLGHGWALPPDLCNTPLIIMNPNAKGYRVNKTLGAQVDLLPTIADLLGLSLSSGDLYQGKSLYAAAFDRTIYLNSAQHRAIVRGSKYILEERSDSSTEYPTHVFEISHRGTKTIFTKIQENADVRRELDAFERYQNALIAFYSDYRKAFAQQPQAVKPVLVAR